MSTLRKELAKIREPHAAFSQDATVHWRRCQHLRWKALATVLEWLICREDASCLDQEFDDA